MLDMKKIRRIITESDLQYFQDHKSHSPVCSIGLLHLNTDVCISHLLWERKHSIAVHLVQHTTSHSGKQDDQGWDHKPGKKQ